MSRQNLAQSGGHPWVAHGCLEGAAGFATDAMQLLGPPYRDAGRDRSRARSAERATPARGRLPDDPVRGRHARSRAAQAAWTFFGLYEPDHAEASSDADLARIDQAQQALGDFRGRPGGALRAGAQPAAGRATGRGPVRSTQADDRRALSGARARGARGRPAHVLLHARWPAQPPRRAARQGADGAAPPRHAPAHRPGHAARTRRRCARPAGCTACSPRSSRSATRRFHKLFSVSRDPYNITRSSGLRILVDEGDGWRLLAVPSAFEIGLSDCRWIYRLDEPHRHGAGGRLGRRPGDAVAHRGRRRALPVPGVRPPGARRARARPRRPDRDRRGATGGSRSAPTRHPCGASAIRMPSTIWSPARRMRSRRSAATSCCTRTASRAAAPTWRCGRARRTSCASPSWAR